MLPSELSSWTRQGCGGRSAEPAAVRPASEPGRRRRRRARSSAHHHPTGPTWETSRPVMATVRVSPSSAPTPPWRRRPAPSGTSGSGNSTGRRRWRSELRYASRTLLPGPKTQALVPRACYPKQLIGVSEQFRGLRSRLSMVRTDRSPGPTGSEGPPPTRGRRKPGYSDAIQTRSRDAVREHCPGDVRQIHQVYDPPLDVRRPDLPRLKFHWRQCHRGWRVVPRAVTFV